MKERYGERRREMERDGERRREADRGRERQREREGESERQRERERERVNGHQSCYHNWTGVHRHSLQLMLPTSQVASFDEPAMARHRHQ